MGVNGTIYYGDAIVINLKYISQEWKTFLNKYFKGREYDDKLISIDSYSDVSEQLITFWAHPPQQLFPGEDRRPLIINKREQLNMMQPTSEGLFLDNEQLWNPSYEGFDIMTLQYKEKSTNNTRVVTRVVNRLRENNMHELISLINIVEIRLVGIWLKFFLH